MLSLDLKGAFDSVAHRWLLWILERKGFPPWLVQTVHSFLTTRHTRIAFSGYNTNWIQMQTGIPHGPPLSPILFLPFIFKLLEDLQQVERDMFGFGFVNNTSRVTW
jgi:hypothetical protein